MTSYLGKGYDVLNSFYCFEKFTIPLNRQLDYVVLVNLAAI